MSLLGHGVTMVKCFYGVLYFCVEVSSGCLSWDQVCAKLELVDKLQVLKSETISNYFLFELESRFDFLEFSCERVCHPIKKGLNGIIMLCHAHAKKIASAPKHSLELCHSQWIRIPAMNSLKKSWYILLDCEFIFTLIKECKSIFRYISPVDWGCHNNK